MPVQQIDNDLPLEIRPYLYEIAERLWSGHATVMVGAGFSKNASKSDITRKSFPSWFELGDVMYEKIHREKPKDNRYLNVLRLAEEVQAAFGRPVLDQLLREYIPDKDHEPSPLFIQLLELPWSDIFTTNYDTLLERTTEQVITQRYDIVINQDDLLHATRPRIVKLHGSFPSERPLIVTEEDYRTYPKKFAPFVNTVQQSLLENTLCLIGFSGDDPNFLQWVGWINDNLGKENSPKIYLIGSLSLTAAQRKLLESKNIIPVDLSLHKDIKGDKSKALEYFVGFLAKRKQTATALEWPYRQQNHFSWTKTIDIPTLLSEWREKRISYPNWVILPEGQRRLLWEYTERFANYEKIFDDLDHSNDLEYAFEFTWRLEKCLCPLFERIVDRLMSILSRYLAPDVEFATEHQNVHCIEVALHILRHYRESCKISEFENLSGAILKSFHDMSPEQLAKLQYEKIISALYQLDSEKASTYLSAWPVNSSLPFWEAKKAGLLAGLGRYEESEAILAKSLYFVRKRLNLTPVLNDYTWVSQEAYVMLIHQVVLRSLGRPRLFGADIVESDEYYDRWNYLAQFKSDPVHEFNYFEQVLSHHYDPNNRVVLEHAFEIGEVDSYHNYQHISAENYRGFALFRLLEDAGFPLTLSRLLVSSRIITAALKRTVGLIPTWSLNIAMQVGDREGINAVMNRNFLLTMKKHEIDSLIEIQLNRYYQFIAEIQKSPYMHSFLESFPEIIGRLVVRSNECSKVSIYSLIRVIYAEGHKLNNIHKLINRLVAASPKELQYQMLPSIIKTPFVNDADHRDEHFFPELVAFLHLQNYIPLVHLSIPEETIETFLHYAETDASKRKSAIARLYTLNETGLLNKKQQSAYYKAIWSMTDTTNLLPIKTWFYRFAFIKLTDNNNRNAERIFKKFILNEKFPIHAHEKDTSSIPGIGSDITLGYEIRYGSKTFFNNGGITWTSEELDVLWLKCCEWWKLDHGYLDLYRKYDDPEDVHSLYTEFQERFSHLVTIISNVFGCQQENLQSATRNEIVSLINEMEYSGVPVLRAKAAFVNNFYPKEDNSFFLAFQRQVTMEKKPYQIDAFDAATIFGEILLQRKDTVRLSALLLNVIEPIQWRIERLFEKCSDVIRHFLKKNIELDCRRLFPPLLEFLDQYYIDSDPENRNKYNIDEKLKFRKISIRLASRINSFLVSKNKDIPEIILKWQQVAESEGEFEDIIHLWEQPRASE